MALCCTITVTHHAVEHPYVEQRAVLIADIPIRLNDRDLLEVLRPLIRQAHNIGIRQDIEKIRRILFHQLIDPIKLRALDELAESQHLTQGLCTLLRALFHHDGTELCDYQADQVYAADDRAAKFHPKGCRTDRCTDQVQDPKNGSSADRLRARDCERFTLEIQQHQQTGSHEQTA